MTNSKQGGRPMGRHLRTCARLGLSALLVLCAIDTPALAAGDGQRGHGGGGGGHGGGGGGGHGGGGRGGGGGGNRGGRGGGYGGWGGGYYPGPAVVFGDPYYCTPPFVYQPQNPYYQCE